MIADSATPCLLQIYRYGTAGRARRAGMKCFAGITHLQQMRNLGRRPDKLNLTNRAQLEELIAESSSFKTELFEKGTTGRSRKV